MSERDAGRQEVLRRDPGEQVSRAARRASFDLLACGVEARRERQGRRFADALRRARHLAVNRRGDDGLSVGGLFNARSFAEFHRHTRIDRAQPEIARDESGGNNERRRRHAAINNGRWF